MIFDVQEFIKHVKNRHGTNITFAHDTKLQHVIDRFHYCNIHNIIYNMPTNLDCGHLVYYLSINGRKMQEFEYSKYSYDMYRLLDVGNKSFRYIYCSGYTFAETFHYIIFYPSQLSEPTLKKLSQMERLKAFL